VITKIWLDDTLRQQYEIGFPILKKYGLKTNVIIGVITGMVGESFERTDPYLKMPCMTVEQLKEMMEWGCEIASHSHTHICIKAASEAELRWELKTSKEWIENNLGVTPKIFIAPFNEVRPCQVSIILEYYPQIRYANTMTDRDVVFHMLEDDKDHKMSKRWGSERMNSAKFRFEQTVKLMVEAKIEKVKEKPWLERLSCLLRRIFKCEKWRKGKGIIVNDVQIGEGTKVWNYANLYSCEIGENCVIGSYAEIGKDVKIGNNCKVECGVFIPTGVTIEDDVFVGPHVVFTNDLYPKAVGSWMLTPTLVKKGASIGANVTIRCGIIIGEGSTIGCGAVVTKDVPAYTIVVGNPAKPIKRRQKT